MNYLTAIICRCCESAGSSLIDLKSEQHKNIVKKLRACADVSYSEDDELPKYLCEKCTENLEFAYKFKIQCEYTDQKIRDSIKLAKSQPKQEPQKKVIPKTNTIQQLEENLLPQKQELQGEEVRELEIADETVTTLTIEHDENFEEILIEETADRNIKQEIPNILDFDGVTFEDYSDMSHLIEESAEVDDNVEHTDRSGNLVELDTIEYDEPTESYRFASTRSENSDKEERDIAYSENSSEHGKKENIEEYNSDEARTEYLSDEEGEEVENDEYFDRSMEDEKKAIVKTKLFQCDTCSAQFVNYLEFNQHKKTHGQMRYQCPICSKWFPKRYSLKNHQLVHTTEQKQFTCTLCNKQYTNQGNLDRHIRVFHEKEKSYSCTICGKSFSQSSTLRTHLVVHIDERNFDCDICHKRYKTYDYLVMHKNRHLPTEMRKKRTYYPPTKKYVPKKKTCICAYCGKRSNTMALHQSHMRTHTGEKPYECLHCNKKFSFQQSLRSHLLTHTGEKPFRCDICGLSFRQIGHLKGHQLVHSGEKQHKCLVCGKTFALRGNLTVHNRLHTGEQPYACQFCPKKFYDSNGLKRHRQIHLRQQQKKMDKENAIDIVVDFREGDVEFREDDEFIEELDEEQAAVEQEEIQHLMIEEEEEDIQNSYGIELPIIEEGINY